MNPSLYNSQSEVASLTREIDQSENFTPYARIVDEQLSFKGIRALTDRHTIHPYPAMLHPLLVDHLLATNSKENDTVLDPFCGSGVTLLQSSRRGLVAHGFDINPLALLIAKAKTEQYNFVNLEKEFDILQRILSTTKQSDIPEIKNIDYWYSSEVIQDLGKIRHVLANIDLEYYEFFLTVFAFIARDQSFTKRGEFKRVRDKHQVANGSASIVTKRLLERTKKIIEVFQASKPPIATAYPVFNNTEDGIYENIRYDLVITSPPYGDSRTTVAYGQFSSFGIDWTRGLNSYERKKVVVDRDGLGRNNTIPVNVSANSLLIPVVQRIANSDKKRANDVLLFFAGFHRALKNVVRGLRPNGRICMVVGNRTVRNTTIPMDQITASFLSEFGLKFQSNRVRQIHNKVMPHQNSPTNQTGALGQTMANEFILAFTKT